LIAAALMRGRETGGQANVSVRFPPVRQFGERPPKFQRHHRLACERLECVQLILVQQAWTANDADGAERMARGRNQWCSRVVADARVADHQRIVAEALVP